MNFTTPSKYINRDVSWLSFNDRVLEEANDKSLPIYERLKFLAIYESNLDEYYCVRVSQYKQICFLGKNSVDEKQCKRNCDLKDIRKEIEFQQIKYFQIINNIIEELKQNKIYLLKLEELKAYKEQVNIYFYDNLFSELNAVFLDSEYDLFLKNNSLYIAVELLKKEKTRVAIIEIPDHFKRFIAIESNNENQYISFIEDIIKLKLKSIIPKHKIVGSYCFKINRDADLKIVNEYEGDIISKIEEGLIERYKGTSVRITYEKGLNKELLDKIIEKYHLFNSEEFSTEFRIRCSDFMSLPNPFSPNLELEKLKSLKIPSLEKRNSIFKSIAEKNHLIHFPYHSYRYVLRFFNEASINNSVTEIKITLYRVAPESSIVNTLINAALNGKKVTVFVEAKARFDEKNNIEVAKKLSGYGVKIIPSIPGIKVHAKLALVIRKENKPNLAFLSTGNFNEQTAKIYSDLGYFTANYDIVEDIENLFNYIEDTTQSFNFKKILVPMFNLKNSLQDKMERELENAKKGLKAEVTVKLNGLDYKSIIDSIIYYSQNGVKFNLIVRGICGINPKYLNDNIKLIRIVDRFLYHVRIINFYNNGENDLYISTADWMKRNFKSRIECIFPIEDKESKDILLEILKLNILDNTKACEIKENLENKKIKNKLENIRVQYHTYEYLKKRNIQMQAK